jgi:hypothetical protein
VSNATTVHQPVVQGVSARRVVQLQRRPGDEPDHPVELHAGALHRHQRRPARQLLDRRHGHPELGQCGDGRPVAPCRSGGSGHDPVDVCGWGR